MTSLSQTLLKSVYKRLGYDNIADSIIHRGYSDETINNGDLLTDYRCILAMDSARINQCSRTLNVLSITMLFHAIHAVNYFNDIIHHTSHDFYIAIMHYLLKHVTIIRALHPDTMFPIIASKVLQTVLCISPSQHARAITPKIPQIKKLCSFLCDHPPDNHDQILACIALDSIDLPHHLRYQPQHAFKFIIPFAALFGRYDVIAFIHSTIKQARKYTHRYNASAMIIQAHWRRYIDRRLKLMIARICYVNNLPPIVGYLIYHTPPHSHPHHALI